MSMGPLRGGKGGPKYEGHMRVPTLSWWPGTIKAGTRTEAIGTTVDLLPSLARLTGARAPRDRTLDGKDILDILLGKPNAVSPHDIHYYEDEGIRRGKWKLVRKLVKNKVQLELYDLEKDLGERRNLANRKPALVKELVSLLDAHARQIAADTRPAAFVEDAKPILTEKGKLPKLRDYIGKPVDKTLNVPDAKGKIPNAFLLPTTSQRNEFVSTMMGKSASLKDVDHNLSLRYGSENRDIAGEMAN